MATKMHEAKKKNFYCLLNHLHVSCLKWKMQLYGINSSLQIVLKGLCDQLIVLLLPSTALRRTRDLESRDFRLTAAFHLWSLLLMLAGIFQA